MSSKQSGIDIGGQFSTSYVQFLTKFDWEEVDFSSGAPYQYEKLSAVQPARLSSLSGTLVYIF